MIRYHTREIVENMVSNISTSETQTHVVSPHCDVADDVFQTMCQKAPRPIYGDPSLEKTYIFNALTQLIQKISCNVQTERYTTKILPT